MLRLNKISPKKPCPFCGAFLENEAPSTIWCHPQNSCLLSLRGITGDDQIAQWDTRFDANGKKVLDDAFTMKQAKKTPKTFLPGGISTTRIIPRFRLPLTRKL